MSLARKLSSALLLPLAAISLSSAAAIANAAPLQTTDEGPVCELTGGTLTWGVKESFRSYISGGIARGSWEATDGASYETPNFTFADGAGAATATPGAEVKFSGKLHFTGHNGLLDLTMSNPTLVLHDEQKATLKLDMRSNDTSGNLAVDETQVPIADINLSGALTHDNNTITITAAPASLAANGVAGFGDFYEAGEELDPVTFSVTSAAGCAGAVFGLEAPAIPVADNEKTSDDTVTAQAPNAEPKATEQAATGSQLPLIATASVLVLLVAGAGVFLVVKKRRNGAE